MIGGLQLFLCSLTVLLTSTVVASPNMCQATNRQVRLSPLLDVTTRTPYRPLSRRLTPMKMYSVLTRVSPVVSMALDQLDLLSFKTDTHTQSEQVLRN